MPANISQLRYTDAEVEQIRSLFPDLDSLKLYRKYLLDLPLTHEEIDRVQALWAPASVRNIIIKTTLPVISGDEAVGVGYDLLNNIPLSEPNFEYVKLRASLFVAAIEWLNSRIQGLDTLPESATGKGQWLTASILAGAWKKENNSRIEDEQNTELILGQLVVKQNVEGILVGLNAIINTPVETDQEKAARIAADSTN